MQHTRFVLADIVATLKVARSFVDDCVEAVLSSDIYIIILGNKTGSYPPDEDRTYTEIELDTALSNDKKIFCLRLENFDESEIDNKAKHNQLLDKFKGRPIHTFKDLTELKNVLFEATTKRTMCINMFYLRKL